mmetsp:Transcript_53391/g.57991  ORF Transcript_53391/g.57991 Transcript_53391/m.57991 type:complete len:348 (+) Transcript_53391:523-1566(+)
MAAPAGASGPLAFLLRSQTGQWMTISLGAIYTFPEQAKSVFGDVGTYTSLVKQLSGFNIPTLEDGKQLAVAAAPAVAPIIIHQHHTNSNSGKNQLVSIAIKLAIGGTACWIGYVVVTTALPDYVQEFFPVTRKFFAKTSRFLQSSIDKVKEVVEEQMGILSHKQDDLSDKLDDTHDSVRGLHNDLQDTRYDISELSNSMERQESTLSASHRTHSYTSRGVTLLVRCVATMLPSNDRTVNDLAEYIKDGEEIQKYEEEKRRLSDSVTRKTPISMIGSPDPTTMGGKKPLLPDNNLLIRESRADSDMDSLEDIHSILGIHKPTDRRSSSSSSSRSIASTARTSFLSVFN